MFVEALKLVTEFQFVVCNDRKLPLALFVLASNVTNLVPSDTYRPIELNCVVRPLSMKHASTVNGVAGRVMN